jgi:hypothetical protein
MKFLRIILGLMMAVVLGIGGLVAGAAPAHASVKNLPCKPPNSNPYNPLNYCASEPWNLYAWQAWNYARSHPHNTRVPFPKASSSSAKKYKNDMWVVYVVNQKAVWQKGAPKNIWKFGETRQADWRDRAKSSRRKCDTLQNTCTYTWVGATKGYYNGRFLEAALIQKYRIKHGFCPPGQPISCR